MKKVILSIIAVISFAGLSFAGEGCCKDGGKKDKETKSNAAACSCNCGCQPSVK